MTPEGTFTVGTAMTWLGLAMALRTVLLAWRRAAGNVAPGARLRTITASALGAGLGVAAGRWLVERSAPPQAAGGPMLPLVWWVMPFSAWLAAGSWILGVLFVVQSRGALTFEERRSKFTAAVACGIAGTIGAWLYQLDPGRTIQILRGGIPLSAQAAGLLALAAMAALGVMVFLSRSPRTRVLGKAMATHLALLAGSVIFGIPLMYLLITSFKEDRDMSSAHGIVWVPRVQRTVPYLDRERPLYRTLYEGRTVEATLSRRDPDGRVHLDIEKPLGLRGLEVVTTEERLTSIPRQVPLVRATMQGRQVKGMVIENLEDGAQRVKVLEPESLRDQEAVFPAGDLEPIRDVGLRWQNFSEALSYLPTETFYGLVFLKNTLLIAALSVIGTLLSSALAAYAFARMRFPGREAIFALFLSTMMLPGAVTMLPQFLIFRQLGWIDTLLPLWAPAFFGSAFNIFMLRQFFRTIPMELEDAAKIDGCSYGRTFWSVMLPQIKPALAVIGIWTFMGAWNNFMGPLIYINSPEKMPISYALQLFMSDRSSEPGLLMAFVTMTIIPVLLLFFFAQRYFIEGVTLSGLGGK